MMAEAYGCEPGDESFTADHFRRHQELFPEGQFIAVDQTTDRVVGFTVSMRMHFDPARPLLDYWWASIGDGWLTTHNPDGDWMYGVESCVLPAYRGKGVGSRLMDARFATLRHLNLRGMVAGGAIIDYGAVADHMTVEDYVQAVIAGQRFDTNLTKQLHKGFQPRGLIPNYCDDETSRGCAVLIVWDNPDYWPAGREPAAAYPLPQRPLVPVYR